MLQDRYLCGFVLSLGKTRSSIFPELAAQLDNGAHIRVDFANVIHGMHICSFSLLLVLNLPRTEQP